MVMFTIGALLIFQVPDSESQLSPELQAAQWLASQQNLDGSWGMEEEIKSLATTSAVIALASIYQRNAAYYKGIAWLENHNVPNVDYRARRILDLSRWSVLLISKYT